MAWKRGRHFARVGKKKEWQSEKDVWVHRSEAPFWSAPLKKNPEQSSEDESSDGWTEIMFFLLKKYFEKVCDVLKLNSFFKEESFPKSIQLPVHERIALFWQVFLFLWVVHLARELEMTFFLRESCLTATNGGEWWEIIELLDKRGAKIPMTIYRKEPNMKAQMLVYKVLPPVDIIFYANRQWKETNRAIGEKSF